MSLVGIRRRTAMRGHLCDLCVPAIGLTDIPAARRAPSCPAATGTRCAFAGCLPTARNRADTAGQRESLNGGTMARTATSRMSARKPKSATKRPARAQPSAGAKRRVSAG